MKKLFTTVAIAGVLSVTTLGALAQGHDGMMGHYGRMDPAKMEKMANERLADLKAKLKVTPSQEGAWTTFAAAMKPDAGMMGKRTDRAEMEKLPLPERIDKMRALRKEHMATMQTQMEKREEAMKTFYAVLTPEQKKIADDEHRKMMGRHHGMGRDKG